MPQFSKTRYDFAVASSGVLSERSVRSLMASFLEDIDKSVDEVSKKLRVAEADRDFYLGHNRRDRFRGMGFVRAADMADFVYRNHMWNHGEAVTVLRNLKTETVALKRLARKIISGTCSVNAVITISNRRTSSAARRTRS